MSEYKLIDDIVRKIISLRAAFVDKTLEIKTQKPDWFNSKDMRSTVFSRCASCTMGATAGLINAAGYIMKPEWWTHHFKTAPSSQVCRNYAKRHEEFIKFAFVLVFFSVIESSIRQIVRTIHPNEFSNSTRSFYSVSNRLLTDLQIPEFTCSLDLFREIRNASHNNGVYCNAKGDRSLEYKHAKYHFKNGKKLDFVSWKLILSLVEDTFDMLVRIVSNQDVASLDHIEDPYSDNLSDLEENPKY